MCPVIQSMQENMYVCVYVCICVCEGVGTKNKKQKEKYVYECTSSACLADEVS